MNKCKAGSNGDRPISFDDVTAVRQIQIETIIIICCEKLGHVSLIMEQLFDHKKEITLTMNWRLGFFAIARPSIRS